MRVYQYEVPPKSILSNLLGALHREPLTLDHPHSEPML